MKKKGSLLTMKKKCRAEQSDCGRDQTYVACAKPVEMLELELMSVKSVGLTPFLLLTCAKV